MHPLDSQGQIKANLITVVIDHLTQIPVNANKHLNVVSTCTLTKSQLCQNRIHWD